MALNIKTGDYIINNNGDVWTVGKVGRNGDVLLIDPAGMEDIVYGSEEVEAWFRKVSDKDARYGDKTWLDPKQYWDEAAPIMFRTRKASKPKSKSKSRSGGSNPTSLRGIR